ncbi:MAG TPA: Tm-1-like ATP-binding domain-containing protein [Syntrophorhabdaceae bacterium]|nr:Tm-1-like ATP-binding domain-containing protein [Syntrophorhabdaceae bacterium]HQM82220.1 Tm-1-like ATP-binding domain-containing protein [Syntrophorhabdaceae bacterium]
MKTILIVSTLDTKGEETFYLRDVIKGLGKEPVVLDISMRQPEGAKADIATQEVAKAGGSTFEEILASKERAKNTAVMTKGAQAIALNMWKEGGLDGIIGIGGSTGSLMATDVMRSLPFGVPKLMISATAALPGMSTRYIDIGDIALLHSVIEISGLSDILKNVIERGATAICAMADVSPIKTKKAGEKKHAVAITMLSPVEQCASGVREMLEAEGYQVIGFSAAGISDRAMELMIEQGFFDGVIDLAPGGVIEHLVGGMKDAGPNRMEAAGKAGIPQVISTGGVNYITPPKSKYTEDHKRRKKYDLDKFRTWIKASPDELKKAAGIFAAKLNMSKGPVKVIIPLKGWTNFDIPGSATYDPEEDRVFVDALKEAVSPGIEIIEVDANIEEKTFARALSDALMKMLE